MKAGTMSDGSNGKEGGEGSRYYRFWRRIGWGEREEGVHAKPIMTPIPNQCPLLPRYWSSTFSQNKIICSFPSPPCTPFLPVLQALLSLLTRSLHLPFPLSPTTLPHAPAAPVPLPPCLSAPPNPHPCCPRPPPFLPQSLPSHPVHTFSMNSEGTTASGGRWPGTPMPMKSLIWVLKMYTAIPWCKKSRGCDQDRAGQGSRGWD